MKNVKLISLALSMLICFVTAAQEKTITGTVSDENTQPFPGVNVTNQNSKQTTQTNFDGKYSVQAQKGDMIVFSFIGMKPQTKVVGDKTVIDVRLEEDQQTLSEVVVVGYGTSSDEYENNNYRPSKRKEKKEAAARLQGRVAGVQIAQKSQYTPNPVIIKGVATISPKNEPLYIIDGVPAKADQIAQINPNDIEDVKILKDASATSVYGNKALNGIMIVNTKNGMYKNLSEKELDAKLKNLNPQPVKPNQEDYDTFTENAFESPKTAPLSTFSIDVDNASYINVRRFINNGQAVPKDAVRVEEMVNFFKYNYPQPKDQHPFSINTELSDSPWNAKSQVLRIGLQGKNIPNDDLPASNLVFLIDVSGSMSEPNKLPLLKQSLKILVNELRAKDKVAIVVYAGAAGLVLRPTSGDEKKTITSALEKLNAGGSTAGGAGIELAYKIAVENFIKNGNNRVILATDGDFNVGSTSNPDMEKLIEEKRKSGVFLTCLGYGMGNYKDSKMETLANKGNGNYAYIDNIQEANRFLGKEFKGAMFAIAKDVKIQIEFNPKQVQAYRLIGYENNNYNGELATIKFRYKKPDGHKSIEMVNVIANQSVSLEKSTDDFKFSSAVAWFGLKLRDSKLIANKSSEDILKLAKQGLTNDSEGYKAEFIRLVETVKLDY